MEVKSGYKKTDIGVIPADWDMGGLDCFWNVIDCMHVTAPFVPNGLPIVSIKEVQNRFVDLTNAKHTTLPFYVLLIEGGREPKAGDLILSRNATVGEVAQVAEFHPPFAMGQDVCLLRKKSPYFSTSYLQAIFRSSIIAKQLSDLMVGSTFKRVNIQQIRNLSVPMPHHLEQEAIAEALNDTDALIESLEQLIAKKRQIKQGTVQGLLTGRKRLPGFRGEWEKSRLGELFTFKNGLNKGKEFFGFGTPIVNYMDVFNNLSIKSSMLEGRVSLTRQELKMFDVKKGDVLFTRTSETPEEIGMTSVILDDLRDTVFSGFLLRGRPKDKRLCEDFKAYYFRSDFVRQQIISKTSYTTRALTNGRILSAVVLLVPPKEEQTAIATVLSDLDAEIATLEAKLAKYRQIKQGMMHNLLTGRIRLT